MPTDKTEKTPSSRQDTKTSYYIKNENINIIRNDYRIIKKKNMQNQLHVFCSKGSINVINYEMSCWAQGLTDHFTSYKRQGKEKLKCGIPTEDKSYSDDEKGFKQNPQRDSNSLNSVSKTSDEIIPPAELQRCRWLRRLKEVLKSL